MIFIYYGAIEAGGTKFVCAVSDGELNILGKISIATTTPKETMLKVFEFFDSYSNELVLIGVGAFGPIDINLTSINYGTILSTPKLAWRGFKFVEILKERYQCHIEWTTDVGAAAYGELKKGAAQEKKSCVYITVGTGIGGGAIVDKNILNGQSHPEMGHLVVKKHPKDPFIGNCPYHVDCLEGLASGKSIEDRVGIKAYNLDENHEIWEMIAYYLAQAIMNYTLILSPEMIILGGGVMQQKQLIPMIRNEFEKLLSGYVLLPDLNEYIVPCKLKGNSGITGCLLLAKEGHHRFSYEH